MDKQTQELALQALDRMDGTIQTLRSLITGKTPAPATTPSPTQPSPAKTGPASYGSPGKRAAEKRQPKFQVAQSVPANELGQLSVLPTDSSWPQAVPQHLIVSNDVDDPAKKHFRAVQMVGLMGIATAGIKVLDCGCGEGYTAAEIANNAADVVGYDPAESKSWGTFKKPNLKFTTQQDEVAQKQYDFIILYDVIDHLEGQNPDEFLVWIASLLAPNGKVFVRCHPWTARHGGHLYEKLNKAYIHLALTTDELSKMGLRVPSNLKIARPLATYDNLITKAGFNIDTRKGQSEPVEKFFSGDILDRIIKVTWRGNIDHATALKIMTNEFIDYVLTKPQ